MVGLLGYHHSGGKDLAASYHSEIEGCRAVVVVWTAQSITSEWVLEEAEIGKSRRILIPVLLDNVRPPFGFGSIQSANLAAWNGDSSSPTFTRLIADIATILGPSAVKDSEERRRLEAEAQRKSDEESLREQKRQWSNESAKKKPDQDNLWRIDAERSRARQEARAPQKQEGNFKPGTVFRDALKNGSQGPEMVVIPAGTFRMGDIAGEGDESEQPVHHVQIIRQFAIGRYEVTFGEYDQFAEVTRHQLPDDKSWGRRAQRPVINVSWNDAVEYAKWLSAQTGKHYRLPSEAEWEYAARSGGKEEKWAGTSSEQDLGEYAWYDANSRRRTWPVGGKKPNGLGLYDTSGNVNEWVQDEWHDNYEGAPTDGRTWSQGNGSLCVCRGGCWSYGTVGLRSSIRFANSRDFSNNEIGFRLARDTD